MYGNKIPDFAMNQGAMNQGMQEYLRSEDQCDNAVKQTAFNRVTGTLYQARELADEICEIAEMLLGPNPPPNLAKQGLSPTRMPGILNDIDEASDETRRQIDLAFAAIKRIRAAF